MMWARKPAALALKPGSQTRSTLVRLDASTSGSPRAGAALGMLQTHSWLLQRTGQSHQDGSPAPFLWEGNNPKPSDPLNIQGSSMAQLLPSTRAVRKGLLQESHTHDGGPQFRVPLGASPASTASCPSSPQMQPPGFVPSSHHLQGHPQLSPKAAWEEGWQQAKKLHPSKVQTLEDCSSCHPVPHSTLHVGALGSR